MNNIITVQGTSQPIQAAASSSAATANNQATGFGFAMSQATGAPQALTPSAAQALMYRSMTTGVPNAEMEQYGGYKAVQAMFDGGGGSYSLEAIPSSQRLQLAHQVAATGVGNMSLVRTEQLTLLPSALSEMKKNGVDDASINEILQRAQQAQAVDGQGVGNASGSAVNLTPAIALNLMQRSMTTGVPKSEMDLYGGYDSVKAMYDSNSGSYSPQAIDATVRHQMAIQVAATGVGNIALTRSEKVDVSASVIQTMAENGIDLDKLKMLPSTSEHAPFVDSNSYIDTFVDAFKEED